MLRFQCILMLSIQFFDFTREQIPSHQTAELPRQQQRDSCAHSETFFLCSMQSSNHHITVTHAPRPTFCTPHSFLAPKTKMNMSHLIVESSHHHYTCSKMFFLLSMQFFDPENKKERITLDRGIDTSLSHMLQDVIFALHAVF